MHVEIMKWTNIKYKLIRKKDSPKTWVKKGPLQVMGKYLYWLFLLLYGADWNDKGSVADKSFRNRPFGYFYVINLASSLFSFPSRRRG